MSTRAPVRVRVPQADEKAWIEGYLGKSWGSATIGTRGPAHVASQLPALVAVQGVRLRWRAS
jgi:hypothetical protein